MQALNIGLEKVSMVAEPHSKEFLYHLRLVSKDKHIRVSDLKVEEVIPTDDCEIYYNNIYIATTSTQELKKLIKASSFATMKLVEVRTEQQTYYAAVDEELLKRKYVGVLTDYKGRVVSFVKHIRGTFWATNGKRLIQLEYETTKEIRYLSAQEAIKELNSKSNKFRVQKDEIILF